MEAKRPLASNRRSAVVGIVLLLALSAVGVFATARLFLGGYVPLLSQGRVAIIPVVGVIDSDRRVLRAIEQFRRYRSVRAFVLEIRSPGGGVAPSQSIFRELRKLKEEDSRPIIAWIGSVGASGGYYVALPADSIMALPGSITGSIGVIMQFPDAHGLLEKIGLNMQVVKSGEFKDMGSPSRALTEGDRHILGQVVEDVYGQFVDAVAESRGMDRAAVVALADGRIVSGERAVDLGLIDRLGTLPDAIEMAGRMAGLGEHPSTIRPTLRRKGWLELLGRIPGLEWAQWFAPSDGGGGMSPSLRYQWP